MKRVSISEIVKKPSILDSVDDVIEVVNKKTNEVKGVFISAKDLPYVKDMIEEIEYRRWLKRNKKGLEASYKELNGIFDEAIVELGKRL
jgi:hypothetical protein